MQQYEKNECFFVFSPDQYLVFLTSCISHIQHNVIHIFATLNEQCMAILVLSLDKTSKISSTLACNSLLLPFSEVTVIQRSGKVCLVSDSTQATFPV